VRAPGRWPPSSSPAYPAGAILEPPMSTAHTLDLTRAVAGLVVLVVVLLLHGVVATRALGNLAANDGRVRTYTAQTWRILIIIVAVIGPLAYFAFGSLDEPR
jgi:uncharacterized membrane protein YkvI